MLHHWLSHLSRWQLHPSSGSGPKPCRHPCFSFLHTPSPPIRKSRCPCPQHMSRLQPFPAFPLQPLPGLPPPLTRAAASTLVPCPLRWVWAEHSSQREPSQQRPAHVLPWPKLPSGCHFTLGKTQSFRAVRVLCDPPAHPSDPLASLAPTLQPHSAPACPAPLLCSKHSRHVPASGLGTGCPCCPEWPSSGSLCDSLSSSSHCSNVSLVLRPPPTTHMKL